MSKISNGIGCIIQARTTSSRLPGKVLKTIDYNKDTTILEEVIRRVKLSRYIDEIVIATTDNKADDEIVNIAKSCGVNFFRGSEKDVLGRYFYAARQFGLQHIVRITSDCPFIDPDVIDELIEMYMNNGYDYASNVQCRTYPHGLDCEVFSINTLENAFYNGKSQFYKEHVTTYIYGNPNEFRLGSLSLCGKDYSDIRITVDTNEDYILACIIKDYLKDDETSFVNIVELFQKKPFLMEVNKNIVQKKIYDTQVDELKAASVMLSLQEMNYAKKIIDEEIECQIVQIL